MEFIMRERASEQLQIEWGEESDAASIKEAQIIFKEQPFLGVQMLESLANDNSNVARIMLGDIYLHGASRIAANSHKAEAFLWDAYKNDSIEAGFRIAGLLRRRQEFGRSQAIYEDLSDRGFAPAQFALGYGHVHNWWELSDANRGEEYLKMGHRSGHLISSEWLYHGKLRACPSFNRLVIYVASIVTVKLRKYITRCVYPHSDRIRNI